MNSLKNPIMTEIEKQKAIIAEAQKAIDAQLEQVKLQEELQANITRCKEYVKKELDNAKKQVQSTKEFMTAIEKQSALFEIRYKEQVIDRSVYARVPGKDVREVVAEIKDKAKYAYIVFTPNPKLSITVKEHYVSSRSSWTSHNKGYKMAVEGLGWQAGNKMYTNAKTVIKKIEDHYQSELAEAARIKAINDLRKGTDWSTMYPGAEVKEETMYDGAWVRGRYDKYANSFTGTKVTLANGIVICLKPYGNGEWHIQSVKYPTPETPTGKALDVMNALNNMKF